MRGRIGRALVGNLRLKLIALLVACGMWVGVVYARNPPDIATVQVLVQAQGLASGLVLLPATPGAAPVGTVPVRVAGIRSNVRSSDVVHGLSAQVDLSAVRKPGRYHVKLRVHSTDPNIELLSYPGSLSVRVDKLVTAALPVHVQVASGQLPPTGYQYNAAKTTVKPATVEVRAPSSIIAKLRLLATISLSEARSPVSVTSQVHLANAASYPDVSFPPTVVTVNASISSPTSERTVVVYVNTSGQPASGYQVVGLQASPLTVIVTGPSGTISSLSAVNTQNVNLNGLTKTTTVQVPLVLPAGVSASSSTVTVAVDIAKVATPTPSVAPSPTP